MMCKKLCIFKALSNLIDPGGFVDGSSDFVCRLRIYCGNKGPSALLEIESSC